MTTTENEFSKQYGPWAFVAGASEGMGEAYAREAAARGLHVVLAARREKELERAAEAIRNDFGVETRSAVVDLSAQDRASFSPRPNTLSCPLRCRSRISLVLQPPGNF